jgi:hypothetical protein
LRRLSIPLTLLLALGATAQAEALHLISTARNEVMLAAPTLRSQAVAEALRQALVVRGVAVFILVDPALSEERASYVLTLALAGAQVRLAPVAEGVLVIDRQVALRGGFWELEGTALPTQISHDAALVAPVVSWFYEVYRIAPVFEYTQHFDRLIQQLIQGGTP